MTAALSPAQAALLRAAGSECGATQDAASEADLRALRRCGLLEPDSAGAHRLTPTGLRFHEIESRAHPT